MPVDVNGISSVFIPAEPSTKANQPKQPVQVERSDERSQQSRNLINRDVIARRVGERSEATEVNIQRFRDTQDLPRQTQNALSTYQSTEQNNLDEDGGELVGVDIFV